MRPVETDLTNVVYKLPGGTEENDLPALQDEESVTSFWSPEADEDLGADAIFFHLHFSRVPKIEVGFELDGELGDLNELDSLGEQGAHPEGGFGCSFELDEGMRSLLTVGGHFVLRVHQRPTPPVSLWLSNFTEPDEGQADVPDEAPEPEPEPGE